LLNLNQANGRPIAQLISVLERLPVTTNSAILSERLADLYVAQGKPASAIHSYEQALKLEPSPQQQLRLRLTLGERLAAADSNREAYENYQQLLANFPDYEDKAAIYRKLLPLARKLNKTADAEAFEAKLKP